MGQVSPGSSAVGSIRHIEGDGSDYMHPQFGRIKLADYTDVTNYNGTMKSDYRAGLDTRGLDTLRDQSVNGKSPWLDMGLQEAQMGSQFARQDSAKQMGQALRRPGSLQGKLQGMKQAGGMGQQLSSGQMQNAYQMMGQANQESGQNLMNQVGREITALQPQQFNISQAMTERNLEDQIGFGNFEEQMKGYAANQTARAQQSAGQSNGALGLGILGL